MNEAPRLRICLAASGGGHLRQLIDLEPICSDYDHFFVTEATALGQSVAAQHRTHYVTHVAVGQARLGKPWLMILSAVKNFREAWRAIRSERPDVVISTGAGTVFFAVLLGWLAGAHVVIIESFARFNRPSIFMRCAALFADTKIVQSKPLAQWWKNTKVFDPLKIVKAPRPEKERLLFVTVGATLPFDRMILAVAQLKREGEIPERVLAQVGENGVKPPEIDTVEALSFSEMQANLRRADIVVCHGGTGSLITALREQCRTIAMPRLLSHREVYDHHQEEITDAFESRGLIRPARDVEELRRALAEIRSIEPVGATSDPSEMMAWLRTLLLELERRPRALNSA